jgi:uncharacterized protein (TIGR02118 family)
MIRLSVLYPATVGTTFNWNYYQNQHFALVRKLLPPHGLIKAEADRGVAGFPIGTSAPYHAIGHMFYANMDDLQRAMDACAAELIADIPKFTDSQPVLQISEVMD